MRRWSALAVALLIAFGAACASSDSNGDGRERDTDPSGKLTIQVSGEPEETRVYRSLASEYRKVHPKVEVEVVEIAEKDDHLAKLTTAFAGGEPPDIFLVNFREYSQFVTLGAVEPIAPWLDDEGVDVDDYYVPPLDAFTYGDSLQCMPQNISSLVVYYNTALFKQGGIERPADDWSWEDFRQTSLSLTEGDVDGVGIEPNIIRLAPFVWSNGGTLVDDVDAPTGFTLDSTQAREAIEFIVSLVRDDGVVPGEEEVAAQDLETRFVTGKLGMLLSSRRDTPAFREVLDLKWDVAPLPVASQPAGILHSDAYCISATSANTEVAANFIAFATGTEGQTLAALSGRTVPSLQEVAESPAFLDPVQRPRHSEVFLDGIPYIQRTPVIPTWPEIEDISEEILTRAFYDPEYTVDRAIRELDEETSALFEEGAPE